MTDTPAIVISRGPGGDVTAEGDIDQFAAALLQRAGFVYVATPAQHWYRLPFDMGGAWENEHATHVAEMLATARYRVALDPDLLPTLPTAEHSRELVALCDRTEDPRPDPDRIEHTLYLLESLVGSGDDQDLLGRFASLLENTGCSLQYQRTEPEAVLGTRMRQLAHHLRGVNVAATHLAMNQRVARTSLRASSPQAARTPSPPSPPGTGRHR